MWEGILAKIRPETKPEPLPPLKHYEPPRFIRGRRRRGYPIVAWELET
jgi:hypothetical protein